MSVLIDYICTNCGFIGRNSDRGISCCDSPQIVPAKEYHDKRAAYIKKHLNKCAAQRDCVGNILKSLREDVE